MKITRGTTRVEFDMLDLVEWIANRITDDVGYQLDSLGVPVGTTEFELISAEEENGKLILIIEED